MYVPEHFTKCSVQNFKGIFLSGPDLNFWYNLLFEAVFDTAALL